MVFKPQGRVRGTTRKMLIFPFPFSKFPSCQCVNVQSGAIVNHVGICDTACP